MFIFSHALFYDFCDWESFHRGSLKSHFIFTEKKSGSRITIQAQAWRKIGQDRKGKEKRVRNRQADRQIKKKLNRPSQKTDACSLFSLSYLDLCSPTTVFKVTAGGNTHSSAPRLLYKTSPSLFTFCRDYTQCSSFTCSSFGQIPLVSPCAASVCFHICACVCVREREWDWGRACHQENNCVCLCISVRRFHFYLRGYFHAWVSVLAQKAFYFFYWQDGLWFSWQPHSRADKVAGDCCGDHGAVEKDTCMRWFAFKNYLICSFHCLLDKVR